MVYIHTSSADQINPIGVLLFFYAFSLLDQIVAEIKIGSFFVKAFEKCREIDPPPCGMCQPKRRPLVNLYIFLATQANSFAPHQK